MMEFGGWYLPDGEKHLIENITKNPKIVDGRHTYQYHKIMLALDQVKSWRRAVDVGGYAGMWSFYLAQRFECVDAFEPVPEHRKCFRLNVTAENVVLHPSALGSADGSATMVLYPNCTMHAHIIATAVDHHPDAKSAQGSVDVPVTTLDSFEFDDVDFLKIDAEGFELDVLKGAVETLKRCKPVIIVEQKAHNGSRYGYDDRAALPFLHAMGARVAAEKARDYVLVWR